LKQKLREVEPGNRTTAERAGGPENKGTSLKTFEENKGDFGLEERTEERRGGMTANTMHNGTKSERNFSFVFVGTPNRAGGSFGGWVSGEGEMVWGKRQKFEEMKKKVKQHDTEEEKR